MKIVIIINRLNVGGAERLVVDDINEMLKRGIEVDLITLIEEKKESLRSQCNLQSKNFHVVHFFSLYDIKGWIRLVNLLKCIHPNSVLTHLWFSNTIGRISAWIARVPVIISFEHNIYDSIKTKKQFFVDKILQKISMHVIAVSEAVKDSLIEHGIEPKKIVVLLNGVDFTFYQNIKQINLRKKLGVDEDEFIFLFIGRLTHQKGIDILLKAFSLVNSGTLVIVGSGEDELKLKNMTKKLGIEKEVSFLGIRHDISSLLKESNCFVLPSRWEGVGIVLLEAMAVGTPIIVSNFKAVREIVKDSEYSIIVEVEDEGTLHIAMKKMLSSVPSRNVEYIKDIINRFSIKRHVDTLLNYIR